MATIKNQIFLTVYRFNSVGNAFVRAEEVGLPLPFRSVVGCAPGPDGRMRVYSKITTGNPPQDYYVPQSTAQLNNMVTLP
jgi:hypothetical protein